MQAQSTKVSTGPELSEPMVAVIGAGLAGMSCARRLRDAGVAVRVFEKSRGIGGRLAQRRLADLSFDLGAQYFTASDPQFCRQLALWQQAGVVQLWEPRLASWRSGQLQSLDDTTQRWVGVPGMNQLARSLAADIEVHLGVRVAPLTPVAPGQPWSLSDEHGNDLGQYAAVLCTAPAQQSAELCAALPTATQQASAVHLAPCFALGLKLPAGQDSGCFDGIFADGQVLSWLARDGSKPGRTAANTWMVHAAPAWSAQHLEADLPWIEAQLLSAFFAQAQMQPVAPELSTLHRWRYAQALDAAQDGCWLDSQLALGIAGDWLCGNRVEGAWRSGRLLAERLLASSALGKGADCRPVEAPLLIAPSP